MVRIAADAAKTRFVAGLDGSHGKVPPDEPTVRSAVDFGDMRESAYQPAPAGLNFDSEGIPVFEE